MIIFLVLFRIGSKCSNRVISEIGDVPLPVIKLNFESLIINSGPLTFDGRATNLCIGKVLVFEVDFDGVTFVEIELSVCTDDL